MPLPEPTCEDGLDAASSRLEFCEAARLELLGVPVIRCETRTALPQEDGTLDWMGQDCIGLTVPEPPFGPGLLLALTVVIGTLVVKTLK